MKSVGSVIWVLRPRLPFFLVKPVMQRRLARRMQDPKFMDDAKAQMHHLQKDKRPEELEDEAREYISHMGWWNEIHWHPRRVTRQRVIGIENLRSAHEEGKGVLLSFVHHGSYGGLFKSIARHGFNLATVTSASSMSLNGPNTRQYLRVVASGGPLISSARGIAGLQEELANGRVVASAIDVPGKTVVEFAGRKVLCSPGLAVAGARSGAPIVVATCHPHGNSAEIHLSKPIYAADFASIDDLAQEIVSQHEPAVVAWPGVAYLPKIAWTPADS